MHVRFALPAIILTCLAVMLSGMAGCGYEVRETIPAATPADDEAEPASEEHAKAGEPADDDVEHEPDEVLDEMSAEAAEVEPESDYLADDHPAVVEVDEEIARRHIGAWIAEGGRLAGSRFIFTDGGHAQMGNHALMFSGEYTIDYSHDDPHLFIRVDVMGRPVDTHFFVEYLPDDQLRFHPAAADPDAPGGVRRQTGSEPMLLVRDE